MNKGNTAESEREIVLTRVLDAPRELVFAAWTDKRQVAQWWGPNGFTNTVYEMDVRPGGVWRFVMHGPDGVDYKNKIVYLEIVEPERIVYLHGSDEEGAFDRFHVTVTFAEQAGKTELTLRMLFGSREERDRTIEFGAAEGGKQTLERLARHLAQPKADAGARAEAEFVLTRIFDAPREMVFKAWTEAERLAQWFGPKGFAVFDCKMDLRPGGIFHYGMRAPNGGEMWGKWVFREIVAPERLVFIASFSDKEAGVTRHPLAPDWPLEMLSTITFAKRDGRTTLTLRGIPYQATELERKTFEVGQGSMQQGWTGTLDQLAAYLEHPTK